MKKSFIQNYLKLTNQQVKKKIILNMIRNDYCIGSKSKTSKSKCAIKNFSDTSCTTHNINFINSIVNKKDNFFKIDLDNKFIDNCTQKYYYIFSEYGYFKYRTIVEVEWLKSLLNNFITSNESFYQNKQFLISQLSQIVNGFNEESCFRIKEIEKVTNHDVKAVEYYVKEQMEKLNLPKDLNEFTHFCCTSEDINNLSHGLMFKEFINTIFTPIFSILIDTLRKTAEKYASVGLMSRTHGQPATPTTFGKEIANFAYRANELAYKLKQIGIKAKMNGAVGNFNAHIIVDDKFDWLKHSKVFIENLGLEFNPYTTQIENHDAVGEILNYIKSINTVLRDLSQDLVAYKGVSYFKNDPTEDCILADNQFIVCNSFCEQLSSKLSISRFQRDLSDSTVMRNFGVVFAHSLKGMLILVDVLEKLDLDKDYLNKELENHYELLAEPLQTVMRYYKFKNPYELLKEHTRGKHFSKEAYINLVSGLELPEDVKSRLIKLTPGNYLGNAELMSLKLKDYLK